MRGASKVSFPKPTLLCCLFDSLVKPVADYGSEILGHTQAGELKIIHRRYGKFKLGVPTITSNWACYGELGAVVYTYTWRASYLQHRLLRYNSKIIVVVLLYSH